MKFCKKNFFVLIIAVLVMGLLWTAQTARAGNGAGCVASAQAGVQEVTLEDGRGIAMVSFRKFCKTPVVVATGSEGLNVQIGVITPSSVTLILTGDSAAAQVYWHALPPTP